MAWLRARARVAPGALERMPAWARKVYPHDWSPVQMLGRQVAGLPSALWGFLLGLQSGYVLLGSGASGYEPGHAELCGKPVAGVAMVSLEVLARDAHAEALHVIGHLIDHHLGCGGEEKGTWLSEGGGLAPSWREAGLRLARLYELGYGLDEVARSGPRDYFAHSLTAYCRDRRALSVADPQIVRWFRSTLWSQAFWR